MYEIENINQRKIRSTRKEKIMTKERMERLMELYEGIGVETEPDSVISMKILNQISNVQ